MCIVSDKLRLCSCKTEKLEKLKHYWVLQRFQDRGSDILGTLVPPADIDEGSNIYNKMALLEALNSGECFDIEMDAKEKDLLELHFTIKEAMGSDSAYSIRDGYLVYAFKYKSGKWVEGDYDPFGNNLEEVQGGKIKRPFQ
jgi:hypothetical protein